MFGCCACCLCLQVIDPLIAHTMELVSADSDRLSNHGCDRTYSNFHNLVTINLPRLITYVVANEEDLQEEAVALYQKVCGLWLRGWAGVRHSGQRTDRISAVQSIGSDKESHRTSQQMVGRSHARYHVSATPAPQHAPTSVIWWATALQHKAPKESLTMCAHVARGPVVCSCASSCAPL